MNAYGLTGFGYRAGFATRFWVQYRKSRYRGSTTYRRYFLSQDKLDAWRKSHPDSAYYTEIKHA